MPRLDFAGTHLWATPHLVDAHLRCSSFEGFDTQIYYTSTGYLSLATARSGPQGACALPLARLLPLTQPPVVLTGSLAGMPQAIQSPKSSNGLDPDSRGEPRIRLLPVSSGLGRFRRTAAVSNSLCSPCRNKAHFPSIKREPSPSLGLAPALERSRVRANRPSRLAEAPVAGNFRLA